MRVSWLQMEADLYASWRASRRRSRPEGNRSDRVATLTAMLSTGRHRGRAAPPTDGPPHESPRALLATLLGAALSAAAVMIAGGGQAIWVCVPAALLVGSRCPGRLRTAGGFAAVLASAGGATLLERHSTEPSQVLLPLLVSAASVAILVSITERLERERDLARASARADPLTGVANRRAMLERIDYEIARHARTRRSFGVLVLDLDGFKLLNDRFGHLAGDDLLREVAGAVQRAIRDQDTLARMGGDEFCVLAPETSPAGARTLSARATESVSRVTVGIEALGASAGTALFPADGKTAAALLHAADQRLLEAKRRAGTAERERRAA
jgi:diguanylate cyclase (GGDEF)-like protein